MDKSLNRAYTSITLDQLDALVLNYFWCFIFASLLLLSSAVSVWYALRHFIEITAVTLRPSRAIVHFLKPYYQVDSRLEPHSRLW